MGALSKNESDVTDRNSAPRALDRTCEERKDKKMLPSRAQAGPGDLEGFAQI